MQEYIQFFLTHWFLSTIFICLLMMIIFTEAQASRGRNSLSPQQAVEQMNHHKAVVFDLRSLKEYQSGSIVGAVHVEATAPDTALTRLNKYKDQPVVLLSSSAKDVTRMRQRLKAAGFGPIYQLAGGLHYWKMEQYPIVKHDS